MAIANKATGLLSMFYPGIPSKINSKGLLKKAKAFANDSSLPVIREAWDHEGNDKAKRGGSLREFESFLKLNDPDKTYSSLRRVCDKDRNAIWITEDSHDDIEKERNNEQINFKAEIDKLKTEKKELQTEKKEFQKEFQTKKKEFQTVNDELQKEFQTVNDKLQKEFKTENDKNADLKKEIDTLKKKTADVLVPYHRPIVQKNMTAFLHDIMYLVNKPEAVVHIFMIIFVENP